MPKNLPVSLTGEKTGKTPRYVLYLFHFPPYNLYKFLVLLHMKIPTSTITSKGQTTIPVSIRKILGLQADSKVLWIPMKPGEIHVVSAPSKSQKGQWAKNLYGKYADNRFDGVQSLIKSRKKDLQLEQRGYL